MYKNITIDNNNVLKLPIFLIVLFLFVSLIPSCLARDFSFRWDANHPNDNVVTYRVYWSTTSGGYTQTNRQDIPLSSLPDQSNPRYTLTLSDAEADQTYYFVCSAVSSHGYESEFSDEINTANQDATPPPDALPHAFNVEPGSNDITHHSAMITWATNKPSNSEVRYGAFSGSWNNYAWTIKKDALENEHRISLSSLSQGKKYYYRVASTDSSGSQIISSEYVFTTLIDQDTLSPEFTSWPTVANTTDKTAFIEWSTNEPSDSTVRYGTSPTTWENYEFEVGSSDLTKNHRISLLNLKGSTPYFFRVASKDIEGNELLISSEQTFTTDQEPDEEEPEITSPPTVISIFETDAGIQSGVINASLAAFAADGGKISAAIAWKTDELSNSEVRYGKASTTWDQYSDTAVDDDLVKKHIVILTGLREGQRYYFRAGSTDAFGNAPRSDLNEINNPFREQSFQIEKPSDSEAPRILSGPELNAIDKNSAVIVWETDEPASSMLQYGLSNTEWGRFEHSKVITDMRIDHSVTISGLSATTQYFFMAGSMDATGNGPGKNENPTNPSAVNSFWTTGFVDETPPDISSIEVGYTTDTTALVQWDTNEPSNSMVQYDLVRGTWGEYEYSANDSEMVMSHNLTLTGLKPDTTYYFRLSSTDANGNGPGTEPELSNPSEELTFITAREPDTKAPQISDVSITIQEENPSVVVEWITDELGNSQVAYGPNSGEWGSYAYSENNPELTREHLVTLTNLATNTPYYIRVSAMDPSGNSYETSAIDNNPSAEFTFQLNSDTSSDDLIAPAASNISHQAPEATSCFISVAGE